MKDQIEALLVLAKGIDPQILQAECRKKVDEGKRAVLQALYQYVSGKYPRKIIKFKNIN